MYGIIIGLIVLLCILLVLVVLAQNAKGGGLSSQFGGSSASNIIGVKKTGDLLEKLTWGFIIGIFVLTLSTNLITDNTSSGGNSILNDPSLQNRQQQAIPPMDAGDELESSDSLGQ